MNPIHYLLFGLLGFDIYSNMGIHISEENTASIFREKEDAYAFTSSSESSINIYQVIRCRNLQKSKVSIHSSGSIKHLI
jgi:hypothetical protein